ncbi:hypothetical protein ACFPRL_35630 [Pseudoclavibacter helvolus]
MLAQFVEQLSGSRSDALEVVAFRGRVALLLRLIEGIAGVVLKRVDQDRVPVTVREIEGHNVRLLLSHAGSLAPPSDNRTAATSGARPSGRYGRDGTRTSGPRRRRPRRALPYSRARR